MKVNKKPRAVSLEFHAKYLGKKLFKICSFHLFSLQLIVFLSCRIIQPEQNWKSWAHKDTLRETHYLRLFMPFMSPKCHIFRLYEFCVIA